MTRQKTSGTEATRTQTLPPKSKREITNITNSQNTKRKYDQPSEQLFPKRWPLSNRNRTKNQSRTNGPINAHLTIAQVMPRYNHNNEKQEALL